MIIKKQLKSSYFVNSWKTEQYVHIPIKMVKVESLCIAQKDAGKLCNMQNPDSFVNFLNRKPFRLMLRIEKQFYLNFAFIELSNFQTVMLDISHTLLDDLDNCFQVILP